MKPEEAAALAGFLKAGFPSMTDEQVSMYESNLLYEDAHLASKAMLEGIREWQYPPRYAEIVERIRVLRRSEQVDAPREEHFNRPVPLWVKRWIVARFLADPRDMRPFHEQHEFAGQAVPGEDWMPEDAYAEEARTLTAEQVRLTLTTLGGAR